MMTKPWRITLLTGCLAIFLTFSQAQAQKATERYIPLGQSPGLSGQATLMGIIRHANPDSGKVTLELQGGGSGTIAVTPETRIWVDRSGQRQPTEPGRFADLVPGLRIEAKPLDQATHQAEWVKVEPGTP